MLRVGPDRGSSLAALVLALAVTATACSTDARGDYPAAVPPEITIVTDGAPSSTRVATTTTAVDGDDSGALWRRIRHDEAVFGGQGDQAMVDVESWRSVVVAVGYDSSGGDLEGAAWLSDDGSVWRRVPNTAGVLGGAGEQVLVSIVSLPDRLVAVGADSSGGDLDGAVWLSEDGSVWRRVPDTAGVLGGSGDQAMLSVVTFGSRLVAAGYDSTGADVDAAVWLSDDGSEWSRLPDPVGAFGGFGDQVMGTIVAGGPGLVAAGSDSFGGDLDAAVWFSPDGVAWQRVPAVESVWGGAEAQSILALVVGGPGVVAVGYDSAGGEADASVWLSVDGMEWTRRSGDPTTLGAGGDQLMSAVMADGPRLIAVGHDGTGDDLDAAVWFSMDGVDWLPVAQGEAALGGPGTQSALSVTVAPTGVVVVGYDAARGDRNAAVWVGPESE